MERGPGVIRYKFSGVPSQGCLTGTHLILPTMMCDDTCQVLKTMEAHLSLHVQCFYCGRSRRCAAQCD